MSHHEMGHHPDEKSEDKSVKAKEQKTWRPDSPDEASTGDQKATQRPGPGEKFHGDKLQNATGGQGSQSTDRTQH